MCMESSIHICFFISKQSNFISLKNNNRFFFTSLKYIYWIFGGVLLVSGLIWCTWLLIEIIQRGGFPNASDSRMVKGAFKRGIAFFTFPLMVFGSGFWICIVIVTFPFKKLRPDFIGYIVGGIGVVICLFVLYLVSFSEIGKWILK